MNRWRYVAASVPGGSPISGTAAAPSAADVRATLRRAGLRPISIAPLRPRRDTGLGQAWHGWARSRRRDAKADLYDSLATLLEAGVSLPEALGTLTHNSRPATGTTPRARQTRSDAPARLCDRLREAIRSGLSLAAAMGEHRAWFDHAELAMVRVGEVRGELATSLRAMAQRHQRAGELAGRIAAALAYPAVVATAGLAVVVFLGTHTLPQIVGVLSEAQVEPPGLTLAVMSVGRAVHAGWWAIPPLAALGVAASIAAHAMSRRSGIVPAIPAPAWVREPALAAVFLDLAELVRVGVPLTEALRVLAPCLRGPVRGTLGRRLAGAAGAIERGRSLAESLDDPRWFDAETVRLVEVGESAGELPAVLRQIGEARGRRARRRVDRLAAMLEPAVIIVLSVLVGLVVMAAVLPLLRLQEVI